jgi:uncharacterized protein (DUF433 family)
MAVLDWSQCPAVESVPGRLGGAWVFRDTRMPVSAVFENPEVGATIDEIVDQFDLSQEQIQAVLKFAARTGRALVDSNICRLFRDAPHVRCRTSACHQSAFLEFCYWQSAPPNFKASFRVSSRVRENGSMGTPPLAERSRLPVLRMKASRFMQC